MQAERRRLLWRRGWAERLVGLFSRPPGWVFHVAVAVTVLGHLWTMSFPEPQLGGVVIFGVAELVLIPVWCVRVSIYGLARRRGTAEGPVWWCIIVPVTALIVFVAAHRLDLVHKARFALSREALDRAAETCLAQGVAGGDCDEIGDRRIGWYSIGTVERVEGGVVFWDSGSGIVFDTAGLAYLPNGVDAGDSDDWRGRDVRHMAGAWYAWVE